MTFQTPKNAKVDIGTDIVEVPSTKFQSLESIKHAWTYNACEKYVFISLLSRMMSVVYIR